MAFDIRLFEKYLPHGVRAEYYDSIDSTNTELVRRVKSGEARCGDVIAAGMQTAGRGRRGNSFSSPEGGIYFSFAAKNIEGAIPTVMSGVAVADTLALFGYSPEIKWVNDVLVCGGKVCGILAEAVGGTGLCVIGIGINLKSEAIPPELKNTAAALDSAGIEIPQKEALAGTVVSSFFALAEKGVPEVIGRYRSYLNFLGEDIVIKSTGEVCRSLDVTERGELVVRLRDGAVSHLNSGEISILLNR